MATARRARTDGPRTRLPNARQAMIEGAVESLRVHGATATSVDRVLAATGAPRGSVYHHFPGGRTQLVTEALTTAGELMSRFIEQLTGDADPVTALELFGASWRQMLLDTEFRAGCPIFAVAVETNDDAPEFAATAAEVFTRWERALTGLLTRDGYPADRAARLSTLTVAAIEGAVAMCRARRDTGPLDDVIAELRAILAH
ncbi:MULTISPECIES: TetR/AcrR family transcriptional regulator [unclassified Nocardia]|uniref:TetR/AcrR family transcriptional regulator n=1 Tax=unclassified Nocardia TaxID=2637762 RepID=UPI001CE49518|nr:MULTISPECIES: TetR/AcrR family transcriptional regulator [unclassified Nocardia]